MSSEYTHEYLPAHTSESAKHALFGHHIRKSLIEEAEEGGVRHPEDIARRIAVLGAAGARHTHLLQLPGTLRGRLRRELVRQSVVAHRAHVERSTCAHVALRVHM